MQRIKNVKNKNLNIYRKTLRKGKKKMKKL